MPKIIGGRTFQKSSKLRVEAQLHTYLEHIDADNISEQWFIKRKILKKERREKGGNCRRVYYYKVL